MQEGMRLLTGWESFYVMVGSSAAALTGLQFVVMALVAERPRGSSREVDAFGTPTIVHFGAVLLLSANLLAPWPTLRGAKVALELMGAAGVGYTLLVVWRTRKATDYRMVFEDWLFHVIFPFISYAVLLGAALSLISAEAVSLFVIAAAGLALLFVGIHNAWDTVTYIALERIQKEKAGNRPHRR